MVQIRTGAGITAISGSSSGNTFSRNRSGAYMRSRTIPTNTRSSSQDKSRSVFAQLNNFWSSKLTQPQRAAWNNYAASIGKLNKLGERIHLTGQLMFLRSNQARQTAGLSLSTDGPTVLSLPEKDTTISFFASSLFQRLWIIFDTSLTWAAENGGALIIESGRPQNITRNFYNSPWRFFNIINGKSGAIPDSTYPLFNPPFPLIAGQKIFLKNSITQADGRTSSPFQASATIQTTLPLSTNIFVADRYNYRIMKRLASDLSYISKIGSQGSGNDQFDKPRGIVSDGLHIYCCDDGNHRIHKRLCSDLSYVSQIGSYGTGDDNFKFPAGVAIDGTYLYVADMSNYRIVKRLCSDLSYVSKIGSSGTGNDQFDEPQNLCVCGDYLYIADMGNHRIHKRLCSDLSYVAKIGTQGSGNDQFYQPYGVATDGIYLYVADSYNDRIMKRLCSDLSYVAKIGSLGTGNDNFHNPEGISCDGTYLYVTDSGNSRIVKRLCSDLSYVSQIGSSGAGNDQFSVPFSAFALG